MEGGRLNIGGSWLLPLGSGLVGLQHLIITREVVLATKNILAVKCD